MGFDLVEGLKGVAVIVAVALIAIVGIFIMAVFGAAIGAFVGCVVSVTPWLGNAVIAGFATFGIADVNLVYVGAALGFIGGFFKSIQVNNKDS